MSQVIASCASVFATCWEAEITALVRVHVLTVKSHDNLHSKKTRVDEFKCVCLSTRQDEMINST